MQINIFRDINEITHIPDTQLDVWNIMKSRGLDKISQYMSMDAEVKQLLVELITRYPAKICELFPIELINTLGITVFEDIMKLVPMKSAKYLSFNVYSLCVDYFNRPLVKVMTTYSEMILIGKYIKWFKKHKIIIETTEKILAYLLMKDIQNIEVNIMYGGICNFRSRFCMHPEMILVECLITANTDMAIQIIDNHVINFNVVISIVCDTIINTKTKKRDKSYQDYEYFNLNARELCPIIEIIIDNTSTSTMLQLYSHKVKSATNVMKLTTDNTYKSFFNQLYCVSCAKYLYNSKPSIKTLIALCIAMLYNDNYDEIEFVKKSKFYTNKIFLKSFRIKVTSANNPIIENHPCENTSTQLCDSADASNISSTPIQDANLAPVVDSHSTLIPISDYILDDNIDIDLVPDISEIYDYDIFEN